MQIQNGSGTAMMRSAGIRSLTGVRGVAALWVLLFHIGEQASNCGLPWLDRLQPIRDGWRGVDLFFILSGFILTYTHQQDFVEIHGRMLVRFAQLRFFRIYPLNTVVLLLIAGLAFCDPGFVDWYRHVHGPEDFKTLAFLKTLFLATRWFLPGSGEWNEPVWSLSVEVLGYTTFPFIVWTLGKCRSPAVPILIGLAGLTGVTFALAAAYRLNINPIGTFSIVRMAGGFVGGVALCRAFQLMPMVPKRWPIQMSYASLTCVVASCMVPHGGILAMFGLGGLVFALAFQAGPIDRFLGSKPVFFLGKISFPLYLIHNVSLLLLVSKFGASPMFILLLPLYVVFCFILSTVLHYSVERPAHVWGRRWARMSGTLAKSAVVTN